MGNSDSSTERTWVVEWWNCDENNWRYNYIDDSEFNGINYLTENEAKDYFKSQLSEFPNLKHRMRNTAPPTTVKGDMKEGLTNGKPQLSQLPQVGLVYTARAFEYGCSPTKYERGNYLRPTVDTLADFDRLLSYLDALLRHATKVTTEMNRARGCTDQTDADLKAAAMCIDKESGLPHLCGMMASGMMAIQQAADAGLIPADPGRPWDKKNQKQI